MNKKTTAIFLAVFIGLGGLGSYYYMTRPTKPPTEMIQPAQAQQQQEQLALNEGEARYSIVSDRSQAAFSLSELLRGEQTLVVGTTKLVTGDLAVNRSDLSSVRIGAIRVNARDLTTDNAMRNNAIKRMILKTENDANEFVVFTPKTVSGIPATVPNGQAFEFEVTGDLLVSGQTREVTFKGHGTFTSDDELSAKAETKLRYADFGVKIVPPPFVTNIEEDVTLSLDFVAKKQ